MLIKKDHHEDKNELLEIKNYSRYEKPKRVPKDKEEEISQKAQQKNNF